MLMMKPANPPGWQVQDLPFRHREDGMDTSRMACNDHVIQVIPFHLILLDILDILSNL